jgi:hypothetical protein
MTFEESRHIVWMAKKKVFCLDRSIGRSDDFYFFYFSGPFIFGKRRSVTHVFCQLLPTAEMTCITQFCDFVFAEKNFLLKFVFSTCVRGAEHFCRTSVALNAFAVQSMSHRCNNNNNNAD